MIKLTSIISEIYVNGFVSTSEKSNFHLPENFDKYDEGSGWIACRGMNDWEAGITACAVYFNQLNDKIRVWFNVKYPDHLKEENLTGNSEKCKKWGYDASEKWIKEAHKIHKVPKEIKSNWIECFKNALESKEMSPYVKEWGVDSIKWTSMKKSN